MAKRTVTVLAEQSLLDIALQEFGTVEGLFSILEDDATVVSVTPSLTAGQLIKLTSAPIDLEVSNYFKARVQKPVTGTFIYIVPPFLCSGPGYIGLVIKEGGGGAALMETASGYWTIRAAVDGAQQTLLSGADIYDMPAGSYCMWPSDAEGNVVETEVMVLGWIGLEAIDLAGMEGYHVSGYVQIISSPLTSLSWPATVGSMADFSIDAPSLVDITFAPGVKIKQWLLGIGPISVASLDNVCNTLDETATGQFTDFTALSIAPTTASQAARDAYEVNNTINF